MVEKDTSKEAFRGFGSTGANTDNELDLRADDGEDFPEYFDRIHRPDASSDSHEPSRTLANSQDFFGLEAPPPSTPTASDMGMIDRTPATPSTSPALESKTIDPRLLSLKFTPTEQKRLRLRGDAFQLLAQGDPLAEAFAKRRVKRLRADDNNVDEQSGLSQVQTSHRQGRPSALLPRLRGDKVRPYDCGNTRLYRGRGARAALANGDSVAKVTEEPSGPGLRSRDRLFGSRSRTDGHGID
ncbi:hypothetical protein [Rhizobium sp. NLR22b]|uniref:hypothetical protein n=1 Tax=Rhizobium sp. NLR22b TaxID=2731115 RepID=UPI001C8357DD|nr:hypothetical protein [Rhizobium sp. NLR22b]MBX5242773.1 hypothetical protein [Rhizobium sp. NLR22b]